MYCMSKAGIVETHTRMSFQLLLALFRWLMLSGALFTPGRFCHRHILGANCAMQGTANAGRYQKISALSH